MVVFGFAPDVYNAGEDQGSQDLTVTLMSGNPGDFSFSLTAATDASSASATATGMYVLLCKYIIIVYPHGIDKGLRN